MGRRTGWNHPALWSAGGAMGGAEQWHAERPLLDFRGQRRLAVVGGGVFGTIMHYGAQAGRWEAQSGGTVYNLTKIFATSDGAQAWTTANTGAILRYTAQAGRWGGGRAPARQTPSFRFSGPAMGRSCGRQERREPSCTIGRRRGAGRRRPAALRSTSIRFSGRAMARSYGL